MKILASDYDNTFYINDEDVIKNINSTKKFMNNNIFLIATGRSYLDFKNKQDLYNIKYNYLIINHGATIIKDNKIIYNRTIKNEIKNELINDLNLNNTISSFACSKFESRLRLDSSDLTKIHVKYKEEESAKKIKGLIESKYSKYINCFLVCKNKAIEIVAKSTDKSEAIKYVAKLEKINENDIYTIGDGYSDINMIKKFNGARIINCIDELKNVTDIEYKSVSTMIDDILSDKIKSNN